METLSATWSGSPGRRRFHTSPRSTRYRARISLPAPGIATWGLRSAAGCRSTARRSSRSRARRSHRRPRTPTDTTERRLGPRTCRRNSRHRSCTSFRGRDTARGPGRSGPQRTLRSTRDRPASGTPRRWPCTPCSRRARTCRSGTSPSNTRRRWRSPSPARGKPPPRTCHRCRRRSSNRQVARRAYPRGGSSRGRSASWCPGWARRGRCSSRPGWRRSRPERRTRRASTVRPRTARCNIRRRRSTRRRHLGTRAPPPSRPHSGRVPPGRARSVACAGRAPRPRGRRRRQGRRRAPALRGTSQQPRADAESQRGLDGPQGEDGHRVHQVALVPGAVGNARLEAHQPVVGRHPLRGQAEGHRDIGA